MSMCMRRLRQQSLATVAALGLAPAGFAQGTEAATPRAVDAQAIPGTLGVSATYGRVKDTRDGFRGATHWHQESVSGDWRRGAFWFGLTANHTESRKHLDTHVLRSGPDAGAQVAGGTSRTITNGLLLRAGTAVGRINLGAFAGYDTGKTHERRDAGTVTARWRRDVHTHSFGGFVSTVVDLGEGWYAIPTAQAIWSQTVSDATTDSLGQPVAEERDRLIRGLFGGEIGYQSFIADRVATVGLRPYVVHDFHPYRNVDSDTAMDLTAFATLSGSTLITGVELNGSVGNGDSRAMSARLFMSLNF